MNWSVLIFVILVAIASLLFQLLTTLNAIFQLLTRWEKRRGL